MKSHLNLDRIRNRDTRARIGDGSSSVGKVAIYGINGTKNRLNTSLRGEEWLAQFIRENRVWDQR